MVQFFKMLEKDIIKTVKDFAINCSKKDDIHGFPHVERVYDMCIEIGEKLKSNLHVLRISALLHDIGRVKESEDVHGKNHAEISAEMASEFLRSKALNLSREDVENVTHCIQAHSFSNNVVPKTLEAKILSDADKLDALGAIGLYRTIGFTVQNNGGIERVIHHLENKILKLKDQMYLDISKEIAEKRQQIILEFYNKIKAKFRL